MMNFVCFCGMCICYVLGSVINVNIWVFIIYFRELNIFFDGFEGVRKYENILKLSFGVFGILGKIFRGI